MRSTSRNRKTKYSHTSGGYTNHKGELIKIFESQSREALEEDMNIWIQENHMEVHTISMAVSGDKYICSILCAPIQYYF